MELQKEWRSFLSQKEIESEVMEVLRNIKFIEIEELKKEDELRNISVVINYNEETLSLNYVQYMYEGQKVGDFLYFGERESVQRITGTNTEQALSINSDIAEQIEEIIYDEFGLSERIQITE